MIIFRYIWILLAGLPLFLYACNKDEGPFLLDDVSADSLNTSGDSSSASVDTIYYSYDIQPIWNSYCTSCHNETNAKLDLRSCCSYDQIWNTGASASYIDTANPGNGNLYRHLKGELSLMPPSQALPEYEIEKILEWIKQGGINN